MEFFRHPTNKYNGQLDIIIMFLQNESLSILVWEPTLDVRI